MTLVRMRLKIPATHLPKLLQLAPEKLIESIVPADKAMGTIEVEVYCDPQLIYDLGYKMGTPSPYQ